MSKPLKLLVTLWPSFPHFSQFANDKRLAGIRLNSAMINLTELDNELKLVSHDTNTVPLFFDIKGRQLRVLEVHENGHKFLDITLNHPIKVKTPVEVLFKAGADFALLDHLEEGGRRLVFEKGPRFDVRPGESLHIRHPSLGVGGELFTTTELAKIDTVKKAGFTKWFLSYVECQNDVDQFQELVGKDAEIWLKIESKRGLEYVQKDFVKKDNLTLVAARGDLYVELDRPHEILGAVKTIIERDPEACVGSRLLLSVVHEPVPSCSDWHELAWLYDIGYRQMMLCDELCLKEQLLRPAVNALDAFRKSYVQDKERAEAVRVVKEEPQPHIMRRLVSRLRMS